MCFCKIIFKFKKKIGFENVNKIYYLIKLEKKIDFIFVLLLNRILFMIGFSNKFIKMICRFKELGVNDFFLIYIL